MTARMPQRHEDFLTPQCLLAHVIYDNGVTAGKAILITQAFVNAFGGVMLFSRSDFIIGENRIDAARKLFELGAADRLRALITWRDGKTEGFLDRITMHPKLSSRFANTHTIDVTSTSYALIHVHAVHPRPHSICLSTD